MKTNTAFAVALQIVLFAVAAVTLATMVIFGAKAHAAAPLGDAVARVWPAAAPCARDVAMELGRDKDGPSEVALQRAPAELARLAICFREMKKRPRLRALLDAAALASCPKVASLAVDIALGVLERSSSVAAELAWRIDGIADPSGLALEQAAVREEVRAITACRLAPAAHAR